MKTKAIMGLVSLAVIASFLVMCPLGAKAGDLPAKVTIAKIKDKKSPVDFPHKAHEAVLAGKCADCHKTPAGGGLKPEFEQKPADMAAALKHPFHEKCLGCHKTSGKETSPTRCDGCHK